MLKVEVIEVGEFHIHTSVHHAVEGWTFHFTAIYASNFDEQRRKTWEELIQLDHPSGPWLIAGDFNEVRYPSEKLAAGGNTQLHSSGLAEMCTDIGFSDIGSIVLFISGAFSRNLQIGLETYPQARVEFL